MSTTSNRRFNKLKLKKNHNKLMLDNIEPQMVGKLSYKLFRVNKYKLVQELNHRTVHTAYQSIFITKFNRNLGIIEIERKRSSGAS